MVIRPLGERADLRHQPQRLDEVLELVLAHHRVALATPPGERGEPPRDLVISQGRHDPSPAPADGRPAAAVRR